MSEPLVPGAPSSALSAGEQRASYVQAMFGRISGSYDRVNRIQSLGLDQRWRRRTLELLELPATGAYLDACCGTGDLAILAARMRPGLRVVGADFCGPMVREASKKAGGPGWLVGDSLRLPFGDGAFDRVTVGFGVRNLADLDAGLRELRRVLKPGGRLGILEASTCQIPGVAFFSRVYLTQVVPRLGGWFSPDEEAYRYLPETILRFPDQEGLASRMRDAGFAEVRFENQLFGVVAVHLGTNPGG